MENVPVTMATQHPDNASSPWWGQEPFISTQQEIDELLELFQRLPVDEYMWDWEGKYVDEAVGEKLFGRANAFFAKRPLGSDLRLTYRIPAFEGKKMHRMARAFMNVLSLADFARDIQLPAPPVTEMFLPLTTSADQPMQVRKAFRDVAGYHRAVFHQSQEQENEILGQFEVTPLVEDVDSLLGIDRIVKPYWEELLRERPSTREHGQRVFLARSDPALNSGIVPAVLAVKAALSIVAGLGDSLGMPVYPVIGTGSLPFRGSVNPTYIDSFLEQYAGVRTYSIQSAFRYDYPLEDVAKALERIKKKAPGRETLRIPESDLARLRALCASFQKIWQPAIEAMAGVINDVAALVPPRRERLQHIGLFGYSRGIGAVKLPRAIGFTAALYSIGVPPELIATGRGLRAAHADGSFDLIETYYPALRADLHHAGKYFNRENLEILSRDLPAFAGVKDDVTAIEETLGITLGPAKPHHLIHRNLTSSILQRTRSKGDMERTRRDLVDAAVIRRSLG